MNQPEDVEVILAHDRRHKFHASVLARNSTFLAGMLTEANAAQLNSRARNAGIKIRWLIALTKLPNDRLPAGELSLIPLNNTGEPTSAFRGLILNENGRIPTQVFSFYEAVFGSFYNKGIKIVDDDMQSALIHALEIITIGEYLGCMASINKPIDNALIKHGQSLFHSIQNMPWGWIDMGIRIKSDVIFTESLVHLAGSWKSVKANPRAMEKLHQCGGDSATSKQMIALVDRLHREIVAKGQKLEMAVASLYPGGMARPSDELPIKRDEYAKDVLVWMALSFLRHWLSQRIISGKGSQAMDSGFELYSQLSRAGEAYMDKTVINQFHGKFPMTKKAMNVLENHLLEIKECIKGVVAKSNIMENKAQLDTHRHPVKYLTCAEVKKEDIPWSEATAQIAKAKELKEKRKRDEEVRAARAKRAESYERKCAEHAEQRKGEGERTDEEEHEDQRGTAKRARYA